MQTKKRHFIKQILSVVILAVFSLAITPWSALHHHEETKIVKEENCTHTVHVKSSAEQCLVCKVHFEKNFVSDFHNYIVYLRANLVESFFPLVSSSFTEVIASCLRGPPVNQ